MSWPGEGRERDIVSDREIQRHLIGTIAGPMTRIGATSVAIIRTSVAAECISFGKVSGRAILCGRTDRAYLFAMPYSRRALFEGGLAVLSGTVALGWAGFAGVKRLTGGASGRISVLDYIPAHRHAAIANRTSRYDCAADIQRALDETSASGKRLFIPEGTYILVPATLLEDEDQSYPAYAALLMRSNLHLEAAPGAIFKIASDVSAEHAPRAMGMFCTNRVLSDISIIGLTMDMNGQRNPISPSRRSGTYQFFNQAHLCVSGTPEGIAARIDRALVDRCTFLNTAGVSCIVMAQSNAPGAQLGKGWVIRNCAFRNNGLDTIDHSSVYGWAEDVLVEDCIFENDEQFGPPGGNTAYEVHGSNTRFLRNNIRRYYRGLWVGENYTSVTENVLVQGNNFEEIKAYGIAFFGEAAAARPIRKVKIYHNVIVFDDRVHDGLELKTGINIASPYSQSDIEIAGNRVRSGGNTVGSAAVAIAAGTIRGQKHTRIVIRNNVAEGTTFGEFIKTNQFAGLGEIEIRDNIGHDLTPGGAFDFAMGVAVAYNGARSRVDRLVIAGNQCIDDRATPRCAYGVYLSGSVGTLEYRPGIVRGMTVADYREDRLTVGRRVTASAAA